MIGTFLNSLKQQSSRRLGCSMDSLELECSWSSSSFGSDSIPVQLAGLLLQGADGVGCYLLSSYFSLSSLSSHTPLLPAPTTSPQARRLQAASLRKWKQKRRRWPRCRRARLHSSQRRRAAPALRELLRCHSTSPQHANRFLRGSRCLPPRTRSTLSQALR